ncbi:MAG: acyl carrier protein [Nitrospirae bacterium]|nr:MAG: acyl carrier protein [Nitrospirota bacterium]
MAPDLTIAERIRTELAKRRKLDVNAIQPHHSLRNDLGLDSADAIELVFYLEEAFDFEVPDQDFRNFTTVSEVIAYVQGRLKST